MCGRLSCYLRASLSFHGVGLLSTFVFVMVFSAASAAGPCGSPFLFDGPEINLGALAVAAETGDFNGDGHADVAVLSRDKFGIMLGNGDGAFLEIQTAYSASALVSMAIADLNTDGISDFVLCESGKNQIVVLIGIGNSTFRAPVMYSLPNYPGNVYIGDLDGDGSSDVITGSLNLNYISVYHGVGDGTLAEVTNLTVGERAGIYMPADVNADGILDLLIVPDTTGQRIFVHFGLGNTQYEEPVEYIVGWGPGGLEVADMNADGVNDVVVANSSSDTVQILYGQQDGGLTVGGTLQVGDRPIGIAIGYFDQDDTLDIVTTNSNDHTVSILTGTANGWYAYNPRPETGSQPYSTAHADFNADGFTDFMVVNHSTVSVLMGRGGGRFISKRQLVTGFRRSDSIIAGDLNGDGFSDIVIPNAQSQGTVHIIRGHDGEFFFNPIESGAAEYSNNAAIGDLDLDGIPDILVTNEFYEKLSFLKGEGNGAFAPPVAVAAPARQEFDLELADMNGDGVLDAISAGWSGIAVQIGNGDGSFTIGNLYGSGSRFGMLLVDDVNGDELLDVVYTSAGANTTTDGVVHVHLGNGDGTLQPDRPYSSGVRPNGIAVGDINEDSYQDIVVANIADHSMTVLMGSPNGIFNHASALEVGYAPFELVIGDMDLDGHLDIVATSMGTGNVSIHSGHGDGTFASIQSYGAGAGALHMDMNDLDSDGDLDLVVLNLYDVSNESLNLSIMINRTDPPKPCRVDLNGDGALNFFDISTFLQYYFAGDPVSDFTQDCTLNFFDLSLFFQEYVSGCQ